MKKVSVQCRHVRLSYGSTEVLKDVDLDIEPGEFFALLGPSGSGKSTLLRLVAGFNRQQSGQLLIDGIEVSAQPPWARNVGMVFQSYALWPHLSVWDNVAFGLVERKVDKATLRQKVGAALDLVGLAEHGQRRPNQLSGGQQQRVALARTLVIEPQVLLLDEPLSNLDKTLRVQMRQELLAMQRRLGLTTIFVTHDQEEAMTTADRMAVLDQGVLQQVGSPAALYDDPVNAFEVIEGWVRADTAVVPREDAFSEGEDAEQISDFQQAQMAASQTNAAAAALQELGREVPMVLRVAETIPGAGAEGLFEPDDVLTDMLITSAPRRLPASSKLVRVRVESSKNRLISVRPLSRSRCVFPLRLSSA